MYEIPADLLQAVVNYLAARPFNEVAQFMGALTQLKAVVAEPELAEVVELQIAEDGSVEVEDSPEA